MALTPEDVLNQKFTITKFRDGYDLDQVDEFLDSIVEELRQREQLEGELRAKLDAANAEIQALQANQQAAAAQIPAAEQTIVVEKPQPVSVMPEPPQASGEADAMKSSAMLQLALELHDKHVQEGEQKRAQLIESAERRVEQMMADAESQRTEVLKQLDLESKDLRHMIKELRDFESEYRTTLRSYIQSQLRNLDGSPEPEGAPAGLD